MKRAAPEGGPYESAGVTPHTGSYFTQLTITSSTSSFVGMGTSRCPARGAANDAMPGPGNVLVNHPHVSRGVPDVSTPAES